VGDRPVAVPEGSAGAATASDGLTAGSGFDGAGGAVALPDEAEPATVLAA
jgi:hypothetical protein